MKIEPSERRPIDTVFSGARGARVVNRNSERYDPRTEQLTRGTGDKAGGVQSGTNINHSTLANLSSDSHTQYSRLYTGSGSPVSAVTPARAGCIYVDTAGPNIWVSHGTSSSDWTQVN